MSEKAKKKQHMILVERNAIKAKNISPTPEELFDLMHLTTCEIAIKRWKWEWITCPVCASTYRLIYDHEYGITAIMEHKTREELKA